MGFPTNWPPPRYPTGTGFGSWTVAFTQAKLWGSGTNQRNPLLRRRGGVWWIWL